MIVDKAEVVRREVCTELDTTIGISVIIYNISYPTRARACSKGQKLTKETLTIYMDGEKESDLRRYFHCEVIFDFICRQQRLMNCRIYAFYPIFIVLIYCATAYLELTSLFEIQGKNTE